MNNKNIEISVVAVSKDFKDTVALNDVSLHFIPGNLYGIIGPAGAGKTTLFRIMLDLMRPSYGDVIYSVNNRIVKFAEVGEHIAYMPQSQSLYADLSVWEHLDFFRCLYGINDADFEKRRRELVHLARLEKFLDRPAGQLSGGMYKKLGLICALLRSPRIIFLDEPTNGVDPISRREFWQLLHTTVEQGILVLMSTAYMDEAERCSQVVLMESGCILASGEPHDLLKRYDSKNFDDLFLSRGVKSDKEK